MKHIGYIVLFVQVTGCATHSSITRHEFTTPTYDLTIMHPCPEGCVSCDKLTLKCVSKKSGDIVIAKGSTWHTLGADGVTPGRFLGYVFTKDKLTYRILEIGVFEIGGTYSGPVFVKEEWK